MITQPNSAEDIIIGRAESDALSTLSAGAESMILLAHAESIILSAPPAETMILSAPPADATCKHSGTGALTMCHALK